MAEPLPDLPVNLRPLATLGVGSYAVPGWFTAIRARMRAGELGERDIEEVLADVTRVVVADQLEAGVDVLTDGEIRRQRFVYEMYQHVEGLERLPPPRRLGITGYDVVPRFRALAPLRAPDGFALVGDFRLLSNLSDGRAVKIAIPGPLTFLGSIEAGGRDATSLIEDTIEMVRTELACLARAGAGYLQVDEPLLAHPPHGLTLTEGAEVINRVVRDLPGLRAVHVCFGNNAGRPFADRRISRLLDAIGRLECDQLLLEFANREMAEVELLRELSGAYLIAAGVIDVKNFYIEPPPLVAQRIERCLEFVAPERLAVTADCGFSALPRQTASAKLRAMTAGAELARRTLLGG